MTPDYRVVVNGTNITPKINGKLISLTLTDERSDKADQLDITLDDSAGQLAIPPRNASIELWLGYKNALVNKGTYTLDEIIHSGPPDVITLRARSADFKGPLKTKREQSWHNISLGDLLTSVAKRNRLLAAINPALAAVLVDHLDQTNESDINLINRLGKHYGAIATVKAGRLLFAPAGEGKTASGTALAGVIINRRDGDTHTYTQTDRDSDYSGVQANWNEKKYAQLKHEIAGEAGNLKTLRHTYQNQKEAQTAAANEWRTLQYQTASLSLTLANGNAELIPETPLTAQGFKTEIDATRWNIARLVHSLGDGGFTTAVECEVLGEGGSERAE